MKIINTARNGRSSLSFRNEGRWTNALALKGDYYLIQFGHNNEPGKPGRSTDMPAFVSNMVSYVTAASTPPDHPYGFVFLNCKLTGDPAPWFSPEGITANTNTSDKLPQADLGRPWRPHAAVSYLNCEMGGHIKPEGWDNWRNPTNELTARYSEYKSTGLGANPAARVKWSRQLTDAEAASYTVENVLRGADDWNPAVQP